MEYGLHPKMRLDYNEVLKLHAQENYFLYTTEGFPFRIKHASYVVIIESGRFLLDPKYMGSKERLFTNDLKEAVFFKYNQGCAVCKLLHKSDTNAKLVPVNIDYALSIYEFLYTPEVCKELGITSQFLQFLETEPKQQ
jgi:hypothetical protein